ncbi:MAG: flagellar protein FliT [Bdellovibrio sp.]|nr:MAG: flagellar protein FliT [Bdellovibrio sp.]
MTNFNGKGEFMERALEILEEKNKHLEKFYSLNESEMLNFANGNFDGLEDFYDAREGILEMIKRMDHMLEKENIENISPQEVSPVLKKRFLKALSYKNDLVTRILSQDLQILSYIESAKSKIISELAQVRAAKKAVGAYKSFSSKNRLDEEA